MPAKPRILPDWCLARHSSTSAYLPRRDNSAGWRFQELVERRAQTFETGAQASSIAANANPEMLRHFKECARHHRRFVLFAQQFDKCLWIAMGEAREKHRPRGRAEAFEVAPRIEEAIDYGAIGGQE